MTETLQKTVDLTDEVDDDRRIATGALLVPDRVDTQGDYFRADTIREIAHDYMARLATGEATLKFMHAVDASEKLSLVENRVLDTPETIGDTEHDAGTWIVSVKAATEEAWRLFKDGLFAGFSIGGSIDGDPDTFAPDEVPDGVHVPDDHPDDAAVRRINAATINEFSPVDQPAVPKAQVEVLKSEMEKNAEALADPDRCRQALIERGHSEEDAERIFAVMHKQDTPAEETASDGAEQSDREAAAGLLARAKRLLTGGTATDDSVEGEDAVAKAGRTLSSANVREAKAIHDAAEKMLDREGVGRHSADVRRYHEDKADPYEEKSANEPAESGVEPSDNDTDMTLNEDEIKSIATEAAEAAVEKRLDTTDDEQTEKDADDTANETDGESELVAAVETLTEKVDGVDERLDELDDRVDKVAKSGADTDQVAGADETDSETKDEASAFKAALGGN